MTEKIGLEVFRHLHAHAPQHGPLEGGGQRGRLRLHPRGGRAREPPHARPRRRRPGRERAPALEVEVELPEHPAAPVPEEVLGPRGLAPLALLGLPAPRPTAALGAGVYRAVSLLDRLFINHIVL